MGLTMSFRRTTTKRGKFELRKEYSFHDWVSKHYTDGKEFFSINLPAKDCKEIADKVIATVKKQKGCERISASAYGVGALRDRIAQDNFRFGGHLISVKASDFEKFGFNGIFKDFEMVQCFDLAVRLSVLADRAIAAGETELIYEIS